MADRTPLTLDDYDAIAEAVQETERGRWFLAEFARRNRSADTAAILDALSGLESRLAAKHPAAELIRDALRATRLARDVSADKNSPTLQGVELALFRALEALGAEPVPARRGDAASPLAIAAPQTAPPEDNRPAAPVVVAQIEPEEQDIDAVDIGAAAPSEPRIVSAPALAPSEPLPVGKPVDEPTRRATGRPGLLDRLSDAEKAILFA